MNIEEVKMNIFDVDSKYSLAHCISSDCALGAGIAVAFEEKYDLKQMLLTMDESIRKHPTCIKVNGVYNLITKEKYWYKPTYGTLTDALNALKGIILEEDREAYFLAMPKIGCGLDRLKWEKVRPIIEEVFREVIIDILICYL